MNTSKATQAVDCQCGDITGERCNWSGAREDTVVVIYVPPQDRGTVEALGGWGVGGTEVFDRSARVEISCGEAIVENGPKWHKVI